MGFKTDTIAAISTAMTNSGIGIVRLSGEDAFSIIDKIYKGKRPKLLSEQKSHTIHYGYIMDGEQTIDEVLVLLMRGPHSYTGEDTVEIDCHGGVFVTRKILETVIKYGARPAEPGEFSKRAFLNGRMDLSQAEAVIDIISSKNDYALQSSVNQLKGSVHNKIKEIREVILYHTAFIESALDDPEHISVDGYGDSLLGVVKDLQQKIQCLLDTADDGRIIKEGIKTVIVGKPNAGKSSLMNVLVGEEKAIVTEIAGTTRDVLEENIQLQGVSLNIMDTAGIRDTSDIVEKIGVDKAKENAEKADLIIYVVDASRPLDENDHEIIEMIAKENGFNEDYVANVAEKSIEAAYPLTIGHRFGMQPYQIMEQPIRVAVAQRQIIENFAKKGDCVIVGRAADVILKGYDPLNIFVYADKESKVERCQRRAPEGEHLTAKEIESRMKQIDRQRAQHHQMYSDTKWGDKGSYDLCINTTKRFVKDIVPAIAKFCEDWFNSHG